MTPSGIEPAQRINQMRYRVPTSHGTNKNSVKVKLHLSLT